MNVNDSLPDFNLEEKEKKFDFNEELGNLNQGLNKF
jgi:hypothetical protein